MPKIMTEKITEGYFAWCPELNSKYSYTIYGPEDFLWITFLHSSHHQHVTFCACFQVFMFNKFSTSAPVQIDPLILMCIHFCCMACFAIIQVWHVLGNWQKCFVGQVTLLHTIAFCGLKPLKGSQVFCSREQTRTEVIMATKLTVAHGQIDSNAE